MAPAELVGIAEIAERLEYSRQTIDNLRTRGDLPEPEYTIGKRPAWRWSTIKRWAIKTGRMDP